MRAVRSGIIGGGFMGQVHAHAVRAAGGKVTCVAGRDGDSARRAGSALGAERVAGSVEELLASDAVDLVHVCTPNVLHAEQVSAVLAAGKPVICEKPLATTVADAARLTEVAYAASLLTAVPFVYRYYPAVREARDRIAVGGDPLWLLHGSYLQDWLADPSATNWRVDSAQGGASRAFGDIGVHWCDLMEFVTGHRIVRVLARMAVSGDRLTEDGRPAQTEDGALVMFETDRGAVGSVVLSQASPGRKNRLWFSFDGRDAGYVFDQELPDSLWIGRLAESRVVPRDPGTTSADAARLSRLPAGHPQGYQDCFTAFVADVHDALEGGRPVGLPTFDDGLRAARLTEAVVESQTQRRWVEVRS